MIYTLAPLNGEVFIALSGVLVSVVGVLNINKFYYVISIILSVL